MIFFFSGWGSPSIHPFFAHGQISIFLQISYAVCATPFDRQPKKKIKYFIFTTHIIIILCLIRESETKKNDPRNIILEKKI